VGKEVRVRDPGEAIHTFDPLLRNLFQRGLVHQVPGNEGPDWQLTPDAQRRLSQVVAVRATPPADRLVYLGRRCAVCGARALTRLRERRYVCEPCIREMSKESDGPETSRLPTASEDHVRVRHGTHQRQRDPGTSLAS
jgi:hypothetical protein